MKSKLKDIILPLGVTILILVVLDIISTAFLPVMGMTRYMIPFNVLIVLYMGFKLETKFLAILILVIQYFHSFFSVEGWEVGTIAGVLICIVISYLRDLIHFNSAAMTITVTQIFQTIWFVIVSSLIYMQGGEMSYIWNKFWRFLPESIVISLLAPFFFSILDRIWRYDARGLLGENQ